MPPSDVLTNRGDNSRVGINLAESKLDVASVNATRFGKLFGRSVDGDLYAQPLIVGEISIAGSVRNVVFLATSKNKAYAYAYDADDPEACPPLWSRNLGAPVPRDDVFKRLGKPDHYLNFGSEIGITSTPAVVRDEKGGGVLYLVAKTRSVSGLGGSVSLTYTQGLHALDLLTGEDV